MGLLEKTKREELELTNTKDQLKRTQEEKDRKYEEILSELSKVEDELKSNNSEKAKYVKEFEKANKLALEKQKELSDLEGKHIALEKVKEQRTKDNEKINKQVNSLSRMIVSKNEDLNREKSEKEALEKEIANIDKSIEATIQQITKDKQDNEKLNSKLTKDLEDKHQEIEVLKKILKMLKIELSQLLKL
ncbi:hypothetical protein MSB_A0903 [Mycoplasma leachii PG50]|uniref:Uncharacterized protein n=1 Tax=Mycoplasma leachii (strain DSM 21131 / NCTC 10133 / N29 / PG50) TaxID=880447 RepID=E4PSU7_MYCLG|nr:hypothetical protein [Mycoplasma leachii]ADR24479.1 hypothetical protein MSB_A0903 [Mycoplasma leachii PG50]CBV67620.1 Viral A-type inclusion protein, putative [Mycoplasma leachii 99/014/6]